MKKKILAILICFMLLFIGYTTVSSLKINKLQKSDNIMINFDDTDLASMIITHTPVIGEIDYIVSAGIHNQGSSVVNIKDMKILIEILDEDEIIESEPFTFTEDVSLEHGIYALHNFHYPFSYKDHSIRVTLDFSNRPDIDDSNPRNDVTETNFPRSKQKQLFSFPNFFIYKRLLISIIP